MQGWPGCGPPDPPGQGDPGRGDFRACAGAAAGARALYPPLHAGAVAGGPTGPGGPARASLDLYNAAIAGNRSDSLDRRSLTRPITDATPVGRIGAAAARRRRRDARRGRARGPSGSPLPPPLPSTAPGAASLYRLQGRGLHRPRPQAAS